MDVMYTIASYGLTSVEVALRFLLSCDVIRIRFILYSNAKKLCWMMCQTYQYTRVQSDQLTNVKQWCHRRQYNLSLLSKMPRVHLQKQSMYWNPTWRRTQNVASCETGLQIKTLTFNSQCQDQLENLKIQLFIKLFFYFVMEYFQNFFLTGDDVINATSDTEWQLLASLLAVRSLLRVCKLADHNRLCIALCSISCGKSNMQLTLTLPADCRPGQAFSLLNFTSITYAFLYTIKWDPVRRKAPHPRSKNNIKLISLGERGNHSIRFRFSFLS